MLGALNWFWCTHIVIVCVRTRPRSIEPKLSHTAICPWIVSFPKITHKKSHYFRSEEKNCRCSYRNTLNRSVYRGFARHLKSAAEITESFEAELETRRTSMRQFMPFFPLLGGAPICPPNNYENFRHFGKHQQPNLDIISISTPPRLISQQHPAN